MATPPAVKTAPKREIKIGLCKNCEHDICHTELHIEDGKLVKVATFKESPMTPFFKIEGCPKQKGTVEQTNHPSRLNYPLKRAGERGENKWKEISWKQAIDEIGEKLQKIKDKYGAETVGCGFGFYNEQWEVARFMNNFGSPNTDSADARICGGTEAWANLVVYGGIAHYGPCDPIHTRLLVIWGNRPTITSPIKWDRARNVEKMIVIDPTRIREVDRADMFLQLRPGSDGALAMGWLNVIINEELYDKEFVAKWTHGFDELKERVQKYPPKKTAELCWLTEKEVVESARMYATVKPGYIQWGSPIGYYGLNISGTERARCCLRAVTGNLDVRGGNQFIRAYSKYVYLTKMEMPDALPPEQYRKAVGSERFKAMSWPGWEKFPDEIKYAVRTAIVRGAPFASIIHACRTGHPYPIRALIVNGSNPILTLSNSRHVYEAIKNTELAVNLDLTMNPTGALMDYVLPVTHWVERPQFSFLEHANTLATGQRALPKKKEGEFDRYDDYDFWRALGIRLGQTEKEIWPWETLEDVYDYRLKPTGMTWEQFSSTKYWDTEVLPHKEHEQIGRFRTNMQKVELSSTIYKDLGYDPLPDHIEPAESPFRTPDLLKDYPYVMISRKCKAFLHSSHRHIDAQRRLEPRPLCEIHPEVAKKHGIEDGDAVWIETRHGRCKQLARVTDAIHPKVICPAFGWWFPDKSAAEPTLLGVWESNVNLCTSDDPNHSDPATGSWYLGVVLARITKCDEPVTTYDQV